MRKRLNLTIHPEIREFAEKLAAKRRRSISQLFEELVEAEWEERGHLMGDSAAPQPKREKASGQGVASVRARPRGPANG